MPKSPPATSKKISKKIPCRTPTPDKKSKSIAAEKFDPIHDAILRVLKPGGAGTLFSDLPKLVEKELSATDRNKVGVIPWIVTTVKLEMEVRGEIARLEGSPQRLVKMKSAAK